MDILDVSTDLADGTMELRWHVVTEVIVDDVTHPVDSTVDVVTGMVIADDITTGDNSNNAV